jgi:hypothetical protein
MKDQETEKSSLCSKMGASSRVRGQEVKKHIRRRHFDALFLTNAFNEGKLFPSVFETVGIRVPIRNPLTRSVAPPATALTVDVFLQQMQFEIIQLSLETLQTALTDRFPIVFVCFVLCCLIAVVYIRADSD